MFETGLAALKSASRPLSPILSFFSLPSSISLFSLTSLYHPIRITYVFQGLGGRAGGDGSRWLWQLGT